MIRSSYLQFSLSEAQWLHRHRTTDYVKEIIKAHNAWRADPLNPETRIALRKALDHFRSSPFHPDYQEEGT